MVTRTNGGNLPFAADCILTVFCGICLTVIILTIWELEQESQVCVEQFKLSLRWLHHQVSQLYNFAVSK